MWFIQFAKDDITFFFLEFCCCFVERKYGFNVFIVVCSGPECQVVVNSVRLLTKTRIVAFYTFILYILHYQCQSVTEDILFFILCIWFFLFVISGSGVLFMFARSFEHRYYLAVSPVREKKRVLRYLALTHKGKGTGTAGRI